MPGYKSSDDRVRSKVKKLLKAGGKSKPKPKTKGGY